MTKKMIIQIGNKLIDLSQYKLSYAKYRDGTVGTDLDITGFFAKNITLAPKSKWDNIVGSIKLPIYNFSHY